MFHHTRIFGKARNLKTYNHQKLHIALFVIRDSDLDKLVDACSKLFFFSFTLKFEYIQQHHNQINCLLNLKMIISVLLVLTNQSFTYTRLRFLHNNGKTGTSTTKHFYLWIQAHNKRGKKLKKIIKRNTVHFSQIIKINLPITRNVRAVCNFREQHEISIVRHFAKFSIKKRRQQRTQIYK